MDNALDLRVARAIPDEGAFTVLDIGCGFDAPRLRSLGSRLARGVGIDERIGEEAKRTPSLSFIEDSPDAAVYTLGAAQFDLILCVSCLERLEDPASVLRQSFHLLVDGGRLLVDVPTWRLKPLLELSSSSLGIRPVSEVDSIRTYFDKRTLWTLLVQAGFRPSRVRVRSRSFGLRLLSISEKST